MHVALLSYSMKADSLLKNKDITYSYNKYKKYVFEEYHLPC